MRKPKAPRAYKEIQLYQLRSFCETARLGSLSAAAKALGLSQPTVWEQVHALERELGMPLIKRQARGCTVTEGGRRVAQLAAPLVQGMRSFKRAVTEAMAQEQSWLTIATTERILAEDLPPAILAFERSHPHVQLRFVESRVPQITGFVQSGRADVGLTIESSAPGESWLSFEPVYELELYLVTPQDHPLARRRHVRPADLLGYPLLNAPGGIASKQVRVTLERLGVFGTQPRIEANYTSVLRKYVELGFGVGMIVGLPGHATSPALHERSMSRHFGTVPVYAVCRKGDEQAGGARTFVELVRTSLQPKQATLPASIRSPGRGRLRAPNTNPKRERGTFSVRSELRKNGSSELKRAPP